MKKILTFIFSIFLFVSVTAQYDYIINTRTGKFDAVNSKSSLTAIDTLSSRLIKNASSTDSVIFTCLLDPLTNGQFFSIKNVDSIRYSTQPGDFNILTVSLTINNFGVIDVQWYLLGFDVPTSGNTNALINWEIIPISDSRAFVTVSYDFQDNNTPANATGYVISYASFPFNRKIKNKIQLKQNWDNNINSRFCHLYSYLAVFR